MDEHQMHEEEEGAEIQLDMSSKVVQMQDSLRSLPETLKIKANVIQTSWKQQQLEKMRKHKEKAARCIQKHFRLHAKKTKELLTSKAVTIQRAWKRYLIRKKKKLQKKIQQEIGFELPETVHRSAE